MEIFAPAISPKLWDARGRSHQPGNPNPGGGTKETVIPM